MTIDHPGAPNDESPPVQTITGACPSDDSCCSAAPPETRDPAWQMAARAARALSWVSLVWMTAEGVLGLVAGRQAGSVSLVAWALGSVIEGLASVIVIWRFTGARTMSETSEATARKAVAVSFFLLAPYIAIQAGYDLLTGHHSGASTLGIILTAASVVGMPLLGIAKQRLGRTLDSGATAGEGIQNLLCAAQAAAVLVGLALTAALGWWWLDPIIGLALAAVAVHEGREAWAGQECC